MNANQYGHDTADGWVTTRRDYWFCECPVPDYDGVECRTCRRKPLAEMKDAGQRG